MSKAYYRATEMVTGGPFKCYNCHQTLAEDLKGTIYEATFRCRRCKTIITIKCEEPIPYKIQQQNNKE